jgi:tetratricopeptide (TPR) repeat protein
MHQLELNERFHFTASVENLTGGQSGSIPADIDFMLRAWPNHHRALNSLSRYQLQISREDRQPLAPVECYFQRAINFSPRDGVSRLLYGIYLHKSGHLEKALEQYRGAEEIAPTDAQIQYNMALCLVDMERYEEARKYADQLYGNGFPLPGLKRKLTEAGYWAEGDGANTN